ncbi:jmjC domain, hydroxylase domain-containing protein [Sarocladium implicatum]|nr:jmjC domain, hydroxylase domain-containing protein [Sarocladium implicatum]
MDGHIPPQGPGVLPVNPMDLPIATSLQHAQESTAHDLPAQQSSSSDPATFAMQSMSQEATAESRPSATLATHISSPTTTTSAMSSLSHDLPKLPVAQSTPANSQTQPQLPVVAPLHTQVPPALAPLTADEIAIAQKPASPPAQLPTVLDTAVPQLTSRPTTPTKQTSSGASSPLSLLSSPLSERSSFTDDEPQFSPNKRQRFSEPFRNQHVHEVKPLMDCEFERDGPEGEGVLRLKPTAEQWADFPAILQFARHHGARNDGCFKVALPEELKDPIPHKEKHTAKCNAYRPKRLKNNFWRVSTAEGEGTFSSSETGAEFTETTQAALQKLKKLFCKHIDRRIRDVRYRPDVPAWTPEQRRRAGVPQRSPVHPLAGDELDFSRAIIPGIHTPYVYESAPAFGATFQIHAEDFKLISLNHLYKGRKIWIVIPSTSIEEAEVAFQRKNKCAQFMRHRAEFIFPDKLKQMGVPHRIIDQRPGETVVILPDAYHQGFSTGYTLAEAKNYADQDWAIDTYQPCGIECKLPTAIPELFMRPLSEGEPRIDLCARYDDAGNWLMPQAGELAPAPVPKRELEQLEPGEAQQMPGEMESKRIRVE